MPRMTNKQREVWRKTVLEDHRWNISYGATRSGKTYLDYWKIPRRLAECREDGGLILMLGTTQGTLRRNIIEPMQAIWGADLVGDIGSSSNQVRLFGKNVYVLGAEKTSQVSKIQGASFQYVYGDEITTWSQNVFDMLKSRMDKPYSKFDGTCNPAAPSHWLKKFMETDGIDVVSTKFTIYDNDYLDDELVRQLEIEYGGSVLYDRYILGNWTAAEGAVYSGFYHDNYISQEEIDSIEMERYFVGVDWGYKHKGVMAVWGVDRRGTRYRVQEHVYTNKDVGEFWIPIAKSIAAKYGKRIPFYCDPARPEYISKMVKSGLNAHRANTLVLMGISFLSSLYNSKRALINRDDCAGFDEEIYAYEWSGTGRDSPKKENDDAMDADRYAVVTDWQLHQKPVQTQDEKLDMLRYYGL